MGLTLDEIQLIGWIIAVAGCFVGLCIHDKVGTFIWIAFFLAGICLVISTEIHTTRDYYEHEYNLEEMAEAPGVNITKQKQREDCKEPYIRKTDYPIYGVTKYEWYVPAATPTPVPDLEQYKKES